MRMPSAESRVPDIWRRMMNILHKMRYGPSFGNRCSVLGIPLLFLVLSACQKPALPDTSSSEYKEAVTAFYSSIASIQSGEDVGAEANLTRVAELAPGEPAVWYNLGLLSLRQNQFDVAGERLRNALTLAPENSDILRLLGVMELTLGNTSEGMRYLDQAIAQNPSDFKARFALAQEQARSGEPAKLTSAALLYESLTNDLPENLVVQLEKARLASQTGDIEALSAATDVLGRFAPDWSEDIQEPFEALKAAAETSDAGQARVQAGFLRNMLLSTYAFRQDLLQVQTPTEEVGDLIDHFILLPAPQAKAAPADESLAYAPSDLAPTISNSTIFKPTIFNPTEYRSISLDGEGQPDMVAWSGSEIQINGQTFAFEISSVAFLDYNYDFLIDVAVAGANGLQMLALDSTGRFTPMPSGPMFGVAAQKAFTGTWVADIDLEGDLDLVLASENGPTILRNNGDGTFAALEVFGDVRNLVDFAWGDFDGDGDPDAALLDAAGELYLYSNERMGAFIRQIVPPIFGNAIALNVADPDADALMDLAVLMNDGTVYTVANRPGEGWVVAELVKWNGFSPAPGSRLYLHDFDNNGAVDVLVSGTESQVWLQTAPATFVSTSSPVEGIVQSVADLNEDGLLDLTGLAVSGAPASWEASGSNDYHWQILRPRAGQVLGDQRINSFAIGGEVETRAGLLYQKQPILSPVVHLGLGMHKKSDVARLIWPNGDIQSEFDLAADESIFTPQRLKGSCPWLFTFDGQQMRFVTDFIWRSPLGLRINAQETAGTVTTEDWVKIRGEELAPRDGKYDIRITADLWETHFFDHVSLKVIDHPKETEIFIDERFGFPPPDMKVHHTSTVKPIKSLRADNGLDGTAMVLHRDGKYLDFFGRGDYQGITRPHFVEIELDEEVLSVKNPLLVAFGWVRPTDSSINVAISQGTQNSPRGLVLEVQKEDGSWEVIRDNIGFPAGKTKTILIDLSDAFEDRKKPKIRLSTNLEIYWDQIGWATQSTENLNVQLASLHSSNLVYRGFSRVTAADRSSPETPDYKVLEGTMPRWRDLVGYYTRFGDVAELLREVDDRYVIMNAGDEMQFLFETLPEPPAGWKRDFVLVGDGWVKDGDYNTAFSKTVLPLPAHGSPEYTTPPTTLHQDPVYQKHAADWQSFHTRYVDPGRFREALAIGN